MITNPYAFCKSFAIVCEKMFDDMRYLILNVVICVSADNYNLYLMRLKEETQAK